MTGCSNELCSLRWRTIKFYINVCKRKNGNAFVVIVSAAAIILVVVVRIKSLGKRIVTASEEIGDN